MCSRFLPQSAAILCQGRLEQDRMPCWQELHCFKAQPCGIRSRWPTTSTSAIPSMCLKRADLCVTGLLVVIPDQAAVRAGGPVQGLPGNNLNVIAPVLRQPRPGLACALALLRSGAVLQPGAVAGNVGPHGDAPRCDGQLRATQASGQSLRRMSKLRRQPGAKRTQGAPVLHRCAVAALPGSLPLAQAVPGGTGTHMLLQ